MSSARQLGDAERHLACLCRELARRGHEVFVALRPTNQWQQILDFVPPANFLYVSIRNSFGMLSVHQLARFVDKRKIDILHAHTAKDYLAASVVRRSINHTGLVITRHVDEPLKPFHRFALRNVDAAIAASPAIREQLTMTFPADRIFMIVKGIPCDAVHRAGTHEIAQEFRSFHEIDPAAPLVMALGELKVSNGQRDLVLAANEIIKRIPNCRFVIAGNDTSVDRKFRRELKRLVKVLHLESQFMWLETPTDTSPLIAAADIVVSLMHSGELASTALDAMAAGVLVVSTSTDQIIGPEGSVPAKNPVALAQAITRYLENEGLRSGAAERLRKAVSEKFSVARMIDETEAVYETVRSSF